MSAACFKILKACNYGFHMISLINIKWFRFVTDMICVFCEMETSCKYYLDGFQVPRG
jgi:hypothetical protein